MSLYLLSISDLSNSFFSLLTFAIIYLVAKFILDRNRLGKSEGGIIRSIVLFSIIIIGLVVFIISLPIQDTDLKNGITSLIGIVISAVLALSSANFIGNGLAGILLRTINNFRPGDFIEVEGHFGRVTERALFHTEIQTENRDLTTLPNLFLASNPVKVTRSSGTFITGVCSLGYDVNRLKIEKTLLEAAKRAELKDAFVRVVELGDFSVVYKVVGLVEEIKTVLSAQSRLNAMMLDCLHEAGIEIVSPNFMNQRQVGDAVFIPKKAKPKEEAEVKQAQADAPESKIFDKADEAEVIEKQKESLSTVEEKVKELNVKLKEATTEEDKAKIKEQIEKLGSVKERLSTKIDDKLEDLSSKK